MRFKKKTKKVILYQGKYGAEVIDASDMNAAFFYLFEIIDEDFGYHDLEGAHIKYYKAAKSGDQSAAQRLVTERRGYEYEGWDLVDLIDPHDV